MATRNSLAVGSALLIGAAFAPAVQAQYQLPPHYQPSPYGEINRVPVPTPQPYPYSYSYPYRRPAPLFALPPSWFYNPYTDGTVRDPRSGGGP